MTGEAFQPNFTRRPDDKELSEIDVSVSKGSCDSGAKRNALKEADLNVLSKLGNQGLEKAF